MTAPARLDTDLKHYGHGVAYKSMKANFSLPMTTGSGYFGVSEMWTKSFISWNNFHVTGLPFRTTDVMIQDGDRGYVASESWVG